MAERDALSGRPDCLCGDFSDFGVLSMGDSDQVDSRFLQTVKLLKDHGGRQWWLYLSQCSACGQAWMIAQDDRVHDNYYLKRVSLDIVEQIVGQSVWPIDFLSFENVLKLGPDKGKFATFFDPNDLTDTVKELMEDRPDILPDEIGYLFCLQDKTASKLMKRAREISWAELRPFA